MARSVSERVQAASGSILTLSGIVAGVGELTGKLATLNDNIARVPGWLLWASSGLLVLLGGWLVARGLSRKSRLLRPEALDLDPDNVNHLRGRKDDIRALLGDVQAFPLVYLEGESGSGKSALVRSGLLPELQKPSSSLLPFYINSYGQDWHQGPRDQLVGAAWGALGNQDRQALGVTSREVLRGQLLTDPANSATPSLLFRIQNELGKTPLLIFDQFDDYQSAHRSRFLRQGVWITAQALCTENPFWWAVKRELEHGAARCLFITRREWSAGLDAVRFVEPRRRSLDPVEASHVVALLEYLVTNGPTGTEPAVANPEVGWDALKNRLIDDLANRGQILPIQARVVFKGLTQLPHLGIAAYERKGGIEGLETAHIEGAVLSAARATGIPDRCVIAALLKLVDESDPALPKARIADHQELRNAAQLDEAGGTRLREALATGGIVRAAVEGATAGSDSHWVLYHDYLARAVVAAHRRADRWQRLLLDRQRAYALAGGLRAHWRALLSPWEQLRLLWPSIRRQVRWVGYRRFGLLSSVRFLPFILALVITGVGVDQSLDWQARTNADQILTSLRSQEYFFIVRGEALRQLWRLAAGDLRLQRAFVLRAMREPNAHHALIEHRDTVAQALVGLDPDQELRRWTLDQLLAPVPSPVGAKPTSLVFRALLAGILHSSNPVAFAERGAEIADLMIKALAVSTDEKQQTALGEALGRLGRYLTPAQAQAGAERLVDALKMTVDPQQQVPLSEALGGLEEWLGAEHVQTIIEQLATVFPDHTWRMRDMGGQLIQAVAQRLVAIIKDPKDRLFFLRSEKMSLRQTSVQYISCRTHSATARPGACRGRLRGEVARAAHRGGSRAGTGVEGRRTGAGR